VPTIPWRSTATADPDAEYLLLASCLPLRSIAKVPWFLRLTASVVRQLERTDGLVGYSLRAQPLARTFWTLSAWTDSRALTAFVRETPHQGVMTKLRPHMGPTRFTTWTAPGSALPMPWDVALGHLNSPSARDRAIPMPHPARLTDRQPVRPDKEQPS
jgi:hypothetical protein